MAMLNNQMVFDYVYIYMYIYIYIYLGKFHHDLTVTEPWNHG